MVTAFDSLYPETHRSRVTLDLVDSDHWDTLFNDLYLGRMRGRIAEITTSRRRSAQPRWPGEARRRRARRNARLGRHSVILAGAGCRVIGVDRSSVLLDEARRRAGDGEWPQWVQADHRELPLEDASFDAALNLFSALGYRGEDGIAARSGSSSACCGPVSSLVVETMHRDRLIRIYQPRGSDPLPDGDLLLEERTFDSAAGRSRRCARSSSRAATRSR